MRGAAAWSETTAEEIMRGEVLSEIFDTAVDVVEGPCGKLAVYF